MEDEQILDFGEKGDVVNSSKVKISVWSTHYGVRN